MFISVILSVSMDGAQLMIQPESCGEGLVHSFLQYSLTSLVSGFVWRIGYHINTVSA